MNKRRNSFIKWIDVGVPLVVFSLFVMLMLHDIGSWYYSVLGDEYSFYKTAQEIASGEKKVGLYESENMNIFSQKGVYNMAPVLVSVYQAVVMKIVGINHNGWIFSSIISVAISFFPFYFLIKELYGRMTAVWSLFIFASSHYIWAFAHTGYWNVLGLFPMVSSGYMAVKSAKSEQGNYFLAGVISSFCLFTNYFVRIVPLIIIVYLINRFRKHSFKPLITFLLGFLVLGLPFYLINRHDLFNITLERSVLYSPFVKDRLRAVLVNLYISFMAFFNNQKITHFVSGSFIDPLSGGLLIAGLCYAIKNIKKYYGLIIVFGLFLLIAGGLSPYTDVAITRLFILVPIISVFCGIALTKLFHLKVGGNYLIAGIICFLLLMAIIGLNGYRFYNVTPVKMEIAAESYVVRILQTVDNCKSNGLVFFKYPDPVLKPALASYGLGRNLIYYQLFDKRLIKPDDNCVIFVRHPDDTVIPDWQFFQHWKIIKYPDKGDRAEIIVYLKN